MYSANYAHFSLWWTSSLWDQEPACTSHVTDGLQVLVGAIPGPGMSERTGTSPTSRQSSGGGRSILATAMLSIAHSSRAKPVANAEDLASMDKQQSWPGASFTEFLPPNGKLATELISTPCGLCMSSVVC